MADRAREDGGNGGGGAPEGSAMPPGAAPPGPPPVAGIPSDLAPPLPRVTPPAVAFLVASAFAPIPILGAVPILICGAFGPAWWLGRERGEPHLDHDRYLVGVGLFPLALGALLFALMAAVAFARAPALGSGESFEEAGEAGTPAIGLSILLALPSSIIAHECAHGIAALWSGDPTARDMGRITANPLRHIDPVGSILAPILSWSAGFAIGWARPVPVAAARLRDRRWGPIAVAAAGPFANIAIALSSLGLLTATGWTLRLARIRAEGLFDPTRAVSVSGTVAAAPLRIWIEALKYGFLVSGLLAGFNLIPLPPLDGSWIFESLLPAPIAGLFRKLRRIGFLLVILAIASGAIEYLLYPALLAILILLYGTHLGIYTL